MATEIKLIAQPRDGGGAPKTFDYKPGGKHAAESKNFYKVMVDGNELPAGTKIVRKGNSVIYNFPDGTNFEIENWCGVTDSKLTDLGASQAYSNDDNAYVNAREIDSGACVIYGDGGQAAASLGDGGGSGPVAATTVADSSDGHNVGGILAGILGLGAIAAAAGGGGGGGGSSPPPPVDQKPVNNVPASAIVDPQVDFTIDRTDGLILSVSDPDEVKGPDGFKIDKVVLSVRDDSGTPGTIAVDSTGTAVVVEGNGTTAITLKGSEAEINKVLETVVYTSDGRTVPREVIMTMTSTDKAGEVDTDDVVLQMSGLGGSSVGGNGGSVGLKDVLSHDSTPATAATTASHAAPASVSLASLIGDPNDPALHPS
jgi:hypothetical protein